MRRSEVWWAEVPAGQAHPVLLLSWDAHADWRDRVSVAEITGTVRGLDAEVELGPRDGMPKRCVVNLDNIGTVRRNVLTERVCTLSPSRMAAVERAVHLALGIALPCSID